MQDPNSRYSIVTRESGCFKNPDSMQFNYCNLIQIWRNHMLGLSMQMNGEIDIFNSITIYPSGNLHFHSVGKEKSALEMYEEHLTDKGKESFLSMTFEELFHLIGYIYTDEQFADWIEYLNSRYIV